MKDKFIIGHTDVNRPDLPERVVDGKVLLGERDGLKGLETATNLAENGDTVTLYRLEIVESRRIGYTVTDS